MVLRRKLLVYCRTTIDPRYFSKPGERGIGTCHVGCSPTRHASHRAHKRRGMFGDSYSMKGELDATHPGGRAAVWRGVDGCGGWHQKTVTVGQNWMHQSCDYVCTGVLMLATCEFTCDATGTQAAKAATGLCIPTGLQASYVWPRSRRFLHADICPKT